MQQARRCWKLLTDSSRCVLNSRHFTTCIKRASSGLYCAMSHEPVNAGTFALRRGPLPAVLQCSSLKQDSRFRKLRGKIPDEIWAIVIFGKICVCLAQVSLSADFPRSNGQTILKAVLKIPIFPSHHKRFFGLRPSPHVHVSVKLFQLSFTLSCLRSSSFSEVPVTSRMGTRGENFIWKCQGCSSENLN